MAAELEALEIKRWKKCNFHNHFKHIFLTVPIPDLCEKSLVNMFLYFLTTNIPCSFHFKVTFTLWVRTRSILKLESCLSEGHGLS